MNGVFGHMFHVVWRRGRSRQSQTSDSIEQPLYY